MRFSFLTGDSFCIEKLACNEETLHLHFAYYYIYDHIYSLEWQVNLSEISNSLILPTIFYCSIKDIILAYLRFTVRFKKKIDQF